MTDIQILITTIVVISIFVVGLPIILGLILPIIKPKISKNGNTYLYAFSSGFFLIIATVLLIGESRIHLEEQFNQIIFNNNVLAKFSTASLLFGVIFLSLLFSLGMKYLFAKRGENHIHSENHDEMIFNISDYNPKSKSFAIFFLLTHRIPDGLIIGLLCSQIAKSNEISIVNIIFLCSFIIHIIPEELIIYYRQIDMGISRKKALLNSLLATCAIIPLIIVGSVIGWFSLDNEIAIHLVQLIAASFLLFISIIEFFPEFLHDVKMSGKKWYITILIFIIGISIAIFIISFHDHDQEHTKTLHHFLKV